MNPSYRPTCSRNIREEPSLDSIAIADLLDRGMLQRVDASGVEPFLQQEGLGVLFFPGGRKQQSDAHDVAVALREILREYPGMIYAGLVEEGDAEVLQSRFRVLVSPSLVLVRGGATLEVIPRVRDWADYSRAFQRYLGAATTDAAGGAH